MMDPVKLRLIFARSSFLAAAILMVPTAYAQSAKFSPMPATLEYVQSDRTELGEREVAEVAALARHFVGLGLRELVSDAGNGEDIFGVDQIFFEADTGRAVMLRLDVAPMYKGINERFLADGDGSLLYHGRTPAGLPYALYFLDFRQEQARSSVEGLEKALKDLPSSQSASLWRETLEQLDPIPSAQAWTWPWQRKQSTPSSGGHSRGSVPPHGVIDSVPASQRSITLTQKLVGCAKGAGKAAYDATLGFAIKVGKGAIKLVKGTAWSIGHPIQAWRRARQRFQDFNAMIKSATQYYAYDLGIGRRDDKLEGLRQGLRDSREKRKVEKEQAKVKLKSAWAQLDDDKKAAYLCQKITQVGIVGATWFLLPQNAAALGKDLMSFMNGASIASKAEKGRILFMETQYDNLQAKYEGGRKAQSSAQKALSRQWARENPREAADILQRYETRI
jgi:hypothetical protein